MPYIVSNTRFGFWAYIPVFYLSTALNAFLSIRCLLNTIDSKIDYLNWILSLYFPYWFPIGNNFVIKNNKLYKFKFGDYNYKYTL